MMCVLASFIESLPLLEQLHNVPTLIYAVFFFCLAAAYLSLWWAAPRLRVFRNMGAFLFLATLQLITPHLLRWGSIPVGSDCSGPPLFCDDRR